jgi:hypothetical protein
VATKSRKSSSAVRSPVDARAAAQTAANQQAFLRAYAETGNISAAAVLASVGRRTHYDWLQADPAYAAAFSEAADEAADALEGEARRRALQGVDQPVFGSMGNGLGTGEVGLIRKYSDTLLIFLLKGARPEKYAERHKHSGPGKNGAFLLEAIVAPPEGTS